MKYCLAILFLLTGAFSFGKGTYQTPDDFIKESLGAEAVERKVFWLEAQDRDIIESILSHKFHKLRIRYWQKAAETVWILDEIGKEAPITMGIHVSNGAIKNVRILIYRESRGDEVRHAFFTRQFLDAILTEDHALDRKIDGITGATLSVRAVTKMSRVALWLDSEVARKALTETGITAK